MRCPKCESTNLYKATSKRYLCKDCKKSSKPEELLPDLANSVTSPANQKLGLKLDISILKDRLGQLCKLSIKQYFAVLLFIILILGGINFLLNRNFYLCSKRQRGQVISKFDPLIENWSNQIKLISNTDFADPYISFYVVDLHKMSLKAIALEVPNCALPVVWSFYDMNEKTTAFYLEILAPEPNDNIIQQHLSDSKLTQEKFLNDYFLFKQGKFLKIEKFQVSFIKRMKTLKLDEVMK